MKGFELGACFKLYHERIPNRFDAVAGDDGASENGRYFEPRARTQLLPAKSSVASASARTARFKSERRLQIY